MTHQDLLFAQEFVYKPSGLAFSNLVLERESKEYGASTFELNGIRITFRVGKITPTKIGQFVTFWQRGVTGPIRPYDLIDPVDVFIVSVRKEECFGQFIFPKSALFEQGFISDQGKGGKRAMRIYPSWDKPDSSQAKKTQAWQLDYFLEIDPNKPIDIDRVRNLFKIF
jgi:hypothetical protein